MGQFPEIPVTVIPTFNSNIFQIYNFISNITIQSDDIW